MISTYPSPEELLSDKFLNKYKNKQPKWGFSNLGLIIFKRTYARRKPNGELETWAECLTRCIRGAQKIGAKYTHEEAERLFDHMFNMRCCFSGRSLWQLGTPTVDLIGMDSLLNCWHTKISEIEDFIFIIIESMLGGGVGCNIAKEYTHELPRVKQNVTVTYKNTKDADFIIPDSKEGWADLGRKILEAFLITGKSFTYSTICIRSSGEPIKTFGGIAPGPQPLVDYAKAVVKILEARAGKKLRTQDVADIICCGGQMVKSGGVRRTALILEGDVDDTAYLLLKRWDLGNIPNYRANSNNSLLCSSFDHLSSKFWEGYNGNGEPYGLLNVPLARKFGRLGESSFEGFNLIDNSIIGFNPCLSKDTTILTSDGVKKIDQLIGKQFTAIIDNKYYNSTDEGFFNQGKKEVFLITLDNGLEIKATANHKFLTNHGWKEVQELKVGIDNIHININDQKWEDNNLTFGQGWLIGSLLGDGYISENQSSATLSYWGNTKLALQQYSMSILKEQFDVRSDVGSGETIKTADRVNVGAVALKNFATSLNLDHNKNLDKSSIEEQSYDFYRGFLSGWFDADGSVQGTQQKGVSVRLTSIKLNNLKIAQRMLLRLGIVSTLYANRTEAGMKKLPNGYRGYKEYYCQSLHELIISKDQLLKFQQIIGFIDQNKSEKLNTILSSYKRKLNITPNTSTVYSIKSVGEEEVYDCTIDQVHKFDANGFVSHNCAEATLADKECCNLATLAINNLNSIEEMIDCAILLYKAQKAIAAGPYLFEETNKIVHKNMRLGLSVAGICQRMSTYEKWCDETYKALRKFDKEWSKTNGYPQSIRLTVMQPNGTLGLVLGSTPGGHPGFAEYVLRRVRFAGNDPLIPILIKNGIPVEPEIQYDGTLNHDTLVASFPTKFDKDTLFADDCSAIQQLEVVKSLQTCWADQAVSVTVYYKPEELSDVKKWLAENYDNSVKSISFLLKENHNFKQAPLEKIDEATYTKLLKNITPILEENIQFGQEITTENCVGGACPIK